MVKIYISPSTQENNIGVGNYGTEEKRMNELADLVVPMLKQNGFEVYRNKPSMTLSQIVSDSNKKVGKNGLHVSLHTNAGGGTGTEIYHYPSSTKGKKLAQNIYNEVKAITPNKGRGVKTTSLFYEVINTYAPSVLLEVIFHDNKNEADFMINNMKEVATAIVKGICDYAGISPKKALSIKSKSGKLYKVQTGAFSKKSNAEDMAERLRKDGYDTLIVSE